MAARADLFASFWGQFGWMSLPLVGGTPWEGALWLLCVGGLIGTLGVLVAPWIESCRRRVVLVLALMIAAGVLLPFLNAYTAPRNQVIQQGRCLFPAHTPVALLIVLGWRPAGLLAGALFGACFAAAALAMLAGFYVWR